MLSLNSVLTTAVFGSVLAGSTYAIPSADAAHHLARRASPDCASIGQFLNGPTNQCVQNCGPLQYLSTVAAGSTVPTCRNCNIPNAITCSRAVAATSCIVGYLLNAPTGQCVTACSSNQYLQIAGSAVPTCRNCQNNGATCSSATTSTSCIAPFLLNGPTGTCVSACGSGQYLATAGSNVPTCRTCPNNAATCASVNVALSCISPFLLNGPTGTCVSNCGGNQYLDTGSKFPTCRNCAMTGAASCSSSSIATGCLSGFFLSNGACSTTDPNSTAAPTSTAGAVVIAAQQTVTSTSTVTVTPTATVTTTTTAATVTLTASASTC